MQVDIRDTGSIPGLGRSSGKARHPTPVFLSGESHKQRSLAGYNPWGCKELDMTEMTACKPTRGLPLWQSWGLEPTLRGKAGDGRRTTEGDLT